jgi:hypothetical protein
MTTADSSKKKKWHLRHVLKMCYGSFLFLPCFLTYLSYCCAKINLLLGELKGICIEGRKPVEMFFMSTTFVNTNFSS